MNVEVVKLVKCHQGLRRFRAIDRSVVAIFVEKREYSTVVEVGVRYYNCVKLFEVKFVSIKSRVGRGRVLRSRVYSAVKQNAARSCLDEHGRSPYLVKGSEGYESYVACFAESGAKDSLADVPEDSAAFFALGVKNVPSARNDLGV